MHRDVYVGDRYQPVIDKVHETGGRMPLIVDVGIDPSMMRRIENFTPIVRFIRRTPCDSSGGTQTVNAVGQIFLVHSDQLFGEAVANFDFKENTQVACRMLVNFAACELKDGLTFPFVFVVQKMYDFGRLKFRNVTHTLDLQ
ncbi:MAG TPA: hypothetical protein DCW29_12810 [Janthinobacterium sp.]|nr:hypothetical protein [Janthinobacterium sp.]